MSEYFPVQKTILSQDALKERILPLYDIEKDHTIRFFHNGLNDTYKVENGTDTYYLRVYRYDWRSKDDINSEITLLNHLSKNKKISVAVPVKKIDGKFVTEINSSEGTRYAALFKSALGSKKRLNDKRSFNYGKTVARIHKESDKLEPMNRLHIDLEHLLDEPLKHVKPFLSKRKDDYRYLTETSKSLKKEIRKVLSKKKGEWGICHGDFHGGNIHFNEKDDLTVFDFDCFGYGWRAYDIAVFLWACGSFSSWSKKDKTRRTRLWNSFLKGYNLERKLSENELKAAYLFVPIRHIWLMGLHTHGSKDWGSGWIDDEYFNELIGFIKKWIENYKLLSKSE